MNKEKGAKVRGPFQVAIDITNDCNYRCLHCYNASGENVISKNELTDKEIYDLIVSISKLKPQNVCFCGGEPLLKKDLMCELANILHLAGVNTVSTVSNGYFLTDKVAKELKENHIYSVQISLDGPDTETCYAIRQNQQAFEKAVDALKALSKAGYNPLSIAFIPNKYNMDRFEETVELCIELGVKAFRCQPLMLSGRGAKNAERLLLNQNEYIRFLKRFYKISNDLQGIIEFEWGDPLEHIIRLREGLTNGFTPAMNIKANGNIMATPYIPIAVGNIRNHSVKEYWDSGYYKIWSSKLLKRVAERIVCIDEMKMEKEGRVAWFDEDLMVDLIDQSDEYEWE